MLTSLEKQGIIRKHKKHKNDSGSSAIQIILLSAEIKKLASHFKKNLKDFHSRRGLIGMIEKRRKLLRYLKKQNKEKYKEIIKEIGLETKNEK